MIILIIKHHGPKKKKPEKIPVSQLISKLYHARMYKNPEFLIINIYS